MEYFITEEPSFTESQHVKDVLIHATWGYEFYTIRNIEAPSQFEHPCSLIRVVSVRQYILQ